MVDSKHAIETIKDGLIELINSGQLNATAEQSDTTISFYVYKTPTETIPLLTLRTSDHRPSLQKYINPKIPVPSEQENTNLSIEFYTPKLKTDGTPIRNRMKKGVSIPVGVDVPKPFTVSSFSYTSEKMEECDINIIYQAILNWIYSEPRTRYVDPFANTEKAAMPMTKTAEIKDKSKITTSNNNKTNENRNMKQTIRLTESDLRNIIMEAINELEPQTYASYAKKRAEQGELDKAKEGQQKAISSFNAKYGSNKPDGRFGMVFNREYDPNGYDVEGRYETHGKHRDDGGNEQATTDIRWNLYNPQRGEVKTDRSITGRPNGGFTAGEWRDVDNDTKQEEWFKVAQQMANPNPEQDYVKGKGWSVDKLDESITRAIRKLLR